MRTFTGGRNLYGKFTNNTTTANLTLGDTMINEYNRQLIQKFPDIFTEQTFTNVQTYPSQQFYNLSSRLRKINTVVITVSGSNGFNWPVKECPSMDFWNSLNLTNSINSDIPSYWFFYNGQLGIYPRPSSGYNPVLIRGQVFIADLSIADYITGTISAVPYALTLTGTLAIGALGATLSSNWTLPTGTYEMQFSSGEKRLVLLTNGATTVTWTYALTAITTSAITVGTSSGGSIVTGASTSWATSQQGFYFNIPSPTGDNFWYQIDTVYDSTHLSLKNPYEGLAISSASASYTIGQASLIPEAYQMIPIYRAAQFYYMTIAPDPTRAEEFKELAKSKEKDMKAEYGNKSTNPTIEDDYSIPLNNPNLAIAATQSSVNQ